MLRPLPRRWARDIRRKLESFLRSTSVMPPTAHTGWIRNSPNNTELSDRIGPRSQMGAAAVWISSGQFSTSNPFVGLALVMLFCALPYLYKIQYPQLDYETRFQLTLFRLTSEYDRSLQLYFQIYPDIKPHTHGMSSTLIRSFLGGSTDEMEPERFIPTYYLGDDYKNTWNAGFIGQAWADWGYWGVAGVSLGLGLLLQVFAVWFRRSKKTALTLGTQVSLMIAGTRLSEVGYTACLLNYGLLSSFLVSFFLRKSKK